MYHQCLSTFSVKQKQNSAFKPPSNMKVKICQFYLQNEIDYLEWLHSIVAEGPTEGHIVLVFMVQLGIYDFAYTFDSKADYQRYAHHNPKYQKNSEGKNKWNIRAVPNCRFIFIIPMNISTFRKKNCFWATAIVQWDFWTQYTLLVLIDFCLE